MGLDNYIYKVNNLEFEEEFKRVFQEYETSKNNFFDYWNTVYLPTYGEFFDLSNEDRHSFVKWDQTLKDLAQQVDPDILDYDTFDFDEDYVLCKSISNLDLKDRVKIWEYRKDYRLDQSFYEAGFLKLERSENSNIDFGASKFICIFDLSDAEKLIEIYPDFVNYRFYQDMLDNHDKFTFIYESNF